MSNLILFRLDLSSTFEILRRYSMRLNSLKCAFRISSSKFIGFIQVGEIGTFPPFAKAFFFFIMTMFDAQFRYLDSRMYLTLNSLATSSANVANLLA